MEGSWVVVRVLSLDGVYGIPTVILTLQGGRFGFHGFFVRILANRRQDSPQS